MSKFIVVEEGYFGDNGKFKPYYEKSWTVLNTSDISTIKRFNGAHPDCHLVRLISRSNRAEDLLVRNFPFSELKGSLE